MTPGHKSRSEWERTFTSAGFEIVDVIDIFPLTIYKIWNVGLRPIFPLLKKMQAYVPDEERRKLKDEWVEIFLELGLPVLEESIKNPKIQDGSYKFQYTLRK